MKKMLFVLYLIYFIGCQSDQKVCDYNEEPHNLEECLSRKVDSENVQCCLLEITNNGELVYNICHQNDESLNECIDDFKRSIGEGGDVKVQCKEDTPNKAFYLKIGFLLILGIIII